jgi:hypothetical protein
MAAKPHDPNAAPGIRVLKENSEAFLIQRISWAIDKVKIFKAQEKRALIYLKDATTAR